MYRTSLATARSGQERDDEGVWLEGPQRLVSLYQAGSETSLAAEQSLGAEVPGPGADGGHLEGSADESRCAGSSSAQVLREEVDASRLGQGQEGQGEEETGQHGGRDSLMTGRARLTWAVGLRYLLFGDMREKRERRKRGEALLTTPTFKPLLQGV